MSTALVGNPNINRRDITRKITGAAVYTYDINPAHLGLSSLYTSMLYMGMVTIPAPHALITKLDTSKAEAAGYVVLTAADLPPYSYWSTNGRARAPLAVNETLYPGQPICAVAAPTTDAVEDAVDLIDVEYQSLPWVNDQEEALQQGAVSLWPGGNAPSGGYAPETGVLPASIHVEQGDVNAAFAAADTTLENVRLDTQLEQHYEMEPWAVVALWSAGVLTCMSEVNGLISTSLRWQRISDYLRAMWLLLPRLGEKKEEPFWGWPWAIKLAENISQSLLQCPRKPGCP